MSSENNTNNSVDKTEEKRASEERSPRKSRSPSRSPPRARTSRSPRRSRSPKRSRSPHKRRYSRSPRRSYSRSPPRRRYRSPPKPEPSRVLGVFGLAPTTRESDLRDEFSRFGELEKVELIIDKRTGNSRCFGFIYFATQEDASKAKETMNGSKLDGRQIRTDFSTTARPHSPTPGKYMGKVTPPPRRDRDRYYSPYRRDRDRDRSPPRRGYDSRDRDRDRDYYDRDSRDSYHYDSRDRYRDRDSRDYY